MNMFIDENLWMCLSARIQTKFTSIILFCLHINPNWKQPQQVDVLTSKKQLSGAANIISKTPCKACI